MALKSMLAPSAHEEHGEDGQRAGEQRAGERAEELRRAGKERREQRAAAATARPSCRRARARSARLMGTCVILAIPRRARVACRAMNKSIPASIGRRSARSSASSLTRHGTCRRRSTARLKFSMSGWSAFYKRADGTGTVTCNNGQSCQREAGSTRRRHHRRQVHHRGRHGRILRT